MATGVVTPKGYANELDRSIHNVYLRTAKTVVTDWDKIAKQENAPKGGSYTESEISGLGQLRSVDLGDSVEFVVPAEGHKITREYYKYGLGFQMVEETEQDDLHGNLMKMPQMLSRNALYKPEAVFWDLFNNGNDVHLGIDSKYLFAANHDLLNPAETGSTTISNLGAADLSETALAAAFEYFDALIDDSGFPFPYTPWLVIAHPDNRILLTKLLKQTGLVNFQGGYATAGSADTNAFTMDFNAMNPGNGVYGSWTPFFSRYFTDTDGFAVLAKEHDFRIMWKYKPRLEKGSDFKTGNTLYKVTERFTAFCNDWRPSYMSYGA